MHQSDIKDHTGANSRLLHKCGDTWLPTRLRPPPPHNARCLGPIDRRQRLGRLAAGSAASRDDDPLLTPPGFAGAPSPSSPDG